MCHHLVPLTSDVDRRADADLDKTCTLWHVLRTVPIVEFCRWSMAQGDNDWSRYEPGWHRKRLTQHEIDWSIPNYVIKKRTRSRKISDCQWLKITKVQRSRHLAADAFSSREYDCINSPWELGQGVGGAIYS